MSLVLQNQRRALESVGTDGSPITLEKGNSYFLDGTEIFFLGVSVGVGTCSDLHGVNIAVFGQEKPDPPRPLKTYETEEGKPITCRYAALLRGATPQELEEDRKPYEGNPPKKCVEGFAFAHQEGKSLHFRKSGGKTLYIVI